MIHFINPHAIYTLHNLWKQTSVMVFHAGVVHLFYDEEYSSIPDPEYDQIFPKTQCVPKIFPSQPTIFHENPLISL